jgi:hypothetical protein
MTDIFVSFWAWLAYLAGSRLDIVTAIPSTFTPYAPAPSNSAFMRWLHLHQSLFVDISTVRLSLTRFHVLCDSPRVDVRDAWSLRIDPPLPPSVPSLANCCVARGEGRLHTKRIFLSHAHLFLPAASARLVDHSAHGLFFVFISWCKSSLHIRIQM